MERAGDLVLALETVAGATVVSVDGELDMATSPQLASRLETVGPESRLVIDLSRCTFFDSTAIRVLATRAHASGAAGGSVAVVVPDPGIRRVLEIAALDRLVELHESRASAI